MSCDGNVSVGAIDEIAFTWSVNIRDKGVEETSTIGIYGVIHHLRDLERVRNAVQK